jgi:hypothetical protein
MSLNNDLCPRCFRKIAEHNWSDDPLNSITGCPYYFNEGSGFLIPQSDPTLRRYKGINQITASDIKQIQDYYHAQEVALGISPLTVFSDLTIAFTQVQKKHVIDEIRTSIQKILTNQTINLSSYLSYDEDSVQRVSPLQTNWFDSDLTKKQINVNHFEDCRKYLNLLTKFREPFDTVTPATLYTFDFTGQWFNESFVINNFAIHPDHFPNDNANIHYTRYVNWGNYIASVPSPGSSGTVHHLIETNHNTNFLSTANMATIPPCGDSNYNEVIEEYEVILSTPANIKINSTSRVAFDLEITTSITSTGEPVDSAITYIILIDTNHGSLQYNLSSDFSGNFSKIMGAEWLAQHGVPLPANIYISDIYVRVVLNAFQDCSNSVIGGTLSTSIAVTTDNYTINY